MSRATPARSTQGVAASVDGLDLAAFERFYKLALAQVAVVCRADVPIVVANVDAAFEAIGARVGELSTLMPKHDFGPMLDMPNLARALFYAAPRVVTPVSSGEIQKRLIEAYARREPLLLNAECLALLGLLPRERVAKIREGKGSYDHARDIIDLVGLFREYEAQLKNKHPFEKSWLDEAEAMSLWLLDNLTTAGVPKPAPAEPTDAAKTRDGLWAMLLERDPMLRLALTVLLGDTAAALIPSLQSRAASPPAQAPVGAPVEPSPASAPNDGQAAGSASVMSAQVMSAPGNSTPPAAIRPAPARAHQQGARARRRR